MVAPGGHVFVEDLLNPAKEDDVIKDEFDTNYLMTRSTKNVEDN